MNRLVPLLLLPLAVLAVRAAWSGHELPIYPSYYPQEIRIETIDQERAADLLLASRIQAYVGGEPRFGRAIPDSIGTVESLGSFLIVRINPDSAKDESSACAMARAVLHGMSGRDAGFVLHPYPVTPFHGDYLDHADLADAAKARLFGAGAAFASPDFPALKVKGQGALAQELVRPDWQSQEAGWDAAVEEVSAADLVASAALAGNAWLGPPWLRAGWFQAALLLQDAVDDQGARETVAADLDRLKAGTYDNTVERIDLEREVTALLAGGCRKLVAGYTVKREHFSSEYSAGIENVGFDAIEGLNSPIFVRTAKLKDFPWNGELSLGIGAKPVSAWNPISGFNDPFGRLLWSALGDPALIPSPNDGAWMLNRVADVQSGATRR
jgi:hypothetical protein